MSGVAIAAESVKIFVNGKEIKSDVPPQIINNRTMVPIRVVSETLGATVNWDGATRSVYITAPWLKSNEQDNAAAGNQVTGGNVQVTVTKTERSAGDEFNTPKAEKEYLIVHLTLKNVGTVKAHYNPLDFKIKDSNGNITEKDFNTVDKDTALSYGELAPGGTVSGTVVFEVPKNDSNLTLIYEYEYNKEVSLKLNS